MIRGFPLDLREDLQQAGVQIGHTLVYDTTWNLVKLPSPALSLNAAQSEAWAEHSKRVLGRVDMTPTEKPIVA